MLKNLAVMKSLLLASTTCVLTLGVTASWADQASIVAPPPGMIEAFIPHSPAIFSDVIARGPEDSAWFPADTPAKTTMIERMDPTGTVTGEFKIPGLNGTQPVEENGRQVRGLAMGYHGEMWFTDDASGGGFVGRITSAGKTSEFAIPQPGYPEGITSGNDGNMWFTIGGTGKIGRIDKDGSITEDEIPTEKQHDMPESSKPVAIAAGSDGNIWFTDQGVNEEGQSFVGRITPSGVISEFAIPTHDSPPFGIALGSDGDMWFTEPYVSKIGRISPGGEFSEFTVSSVSRQITAGSDGNLWFTENSGANAIGRITPTGIVTNFGPIGVSPVGIAAGAAGDLWLTETYFVHVDKLTIPMMPVNYGPPAISGEAVEGRALSVSDGLWSNNPESFTYLWQTCDAVGEHCTDLKGETGAVHPLSAGDVGHTLRAVVSATNIGGSASAVSAASALVFVPPSILPLASNPMPVVDATMTWSFRWLHVYSTVKSLIVNRPTGGGSIEIDCNGGGCPFSHKRLVTTADSRACNGQRCARKRPTPLRRNVDLTRLFRGRHLKAGTRILVNVSKAGWLSRSFLFTIRSGRAPRVQRQCGTNLNNYREAC